MQDTSENVTDRSVGSPTGWDLAATIAGRVSPPGPVASREDLEGLVAGLRTAAGVAVGHVEQLTGLRPDDVAAGETRVRVVDRVSWMRANAAMLATMTEPILPTGRGPLAQLSRGVSAGQVGGVLALLAPRVLGQFDPFAPAPAVVARRGADPEPAGRAGQLLLVAPNVLRMERELSAEPAQFRLWVCLHEQTHALQFAAAPWLVGELQARTQRLLESLGQEAAGQRGGTTVLRDVADAVLRAVTGSGHPSDAGATPDLAAAAAGSPVLGAVLSAEQQRMFVEVTAVMSLLEGHADVTMDAVGEGVLPGVRSIRAAFESKRDGTGVLDRVLRRLLGLDLKMAQYRDGAAFVRAAQAAVGRDGFNAVWADAAHLPTPEEIADPSSWVRRVHG